MTIKTQVSARQIKDWNRIAAKLPGRTNKDCRKRWVNKVCGSLKKGAWNKEEDERLRDAVSIHGQRCGSNICLLLWNPHTDFAEVEIICLRQGR